MSRDDFHLYEICFFVLFYTLPGHVRIFTQMNPTRQKKEEAADSSALSGEQRHIKCKDTFLDILNGAISESLEPIPRFYFVSPTRVLFVWVMDRELQGFYLLDQITGFCLNNSFF